MNRLFPVRHGVCLHGIYLLVFAIFLSSFAAPRAVRATISAGADASVWDSAVPQSAPVFGVGGSGQVDGEFILDTVDLGSTAIQVGIRAQERFQGPTLQRIGNVYFADSGTNFSGGGVEGALWNYDFHLDFGTGDSDTTVAGHSLESEILKSLSPLNMRDFTVELLLDDDASAATDFITVDLNAVLAEGIFGDDILLFQASSNLLFTGGPPSFDPDVPGIYDFELRVRDSVSGDTVAKSLMRVVVDATDFDTVDLGVTVTESADPVIVTPGGGASSLTYEVLLANTGPSVASDVAVLAALTLPAGVTVDSTSATDGTVVPVGGGFTWSLASLADGALESLQIVLTVPSDTALGADTIACTAAVTAVTETDSNLFNESGGQSTSVACNDADGDLVCDVVDNCPADANASQTDTDGDGNGNVCDICFGDDATGDTDGDGVCDDFDSCQGDDLTGDADSDGICADLDCDDEDPTNACAFIFTDGFESGNLTLWTAVVP